MRRTALSLLLLLLAGGASAQVTTLTPPVIKWGTGMGNSVAPPVMLLGYDGGLPCIVGSTPTCSIPTTGGGGGGGTSSAFDAAFPADGTAVGVSDGTNMKMLLAPIALGDGVNGNNMLSVGSWVWNGTTWDRQRGDTTSGQWVQVKASALLNVVSTSQYPSGATPETISATGTTAATTATLAATSGKTTFICGFSIRANASASATGNATVTGTVTGTLNFTQWTAPNTSGLGITEMIFSPCVPASGTNTTISVVSAAPGTGGIVSVSAWGYEL